MTLITGITGKGVTGRGDRVPAESKIGVLKIVVPTFKLRYFPTVTKLGEYEKKRDFDRTPEPKGAGRGKCSDELQFVIQQHAATRMHYDLRIEINGVLKSWAVPEGPTLDPKVRKLALRTEDHPIEYTGFEGVIPKGQYGGGKMIVWDRGTWVPMTEPELVDKDGELKFRLFGEKVRGGFMLKKLKQKGNEWLLIKERDSECVSETEYALVDEFPLSVISGVSVEDIDTSFGAERVEPVYPEHLKGAKKAAMPASVLPSLPTLTSTPPSGDEWVHEIKFDGYRVSCLISDGNVTILTRNGHDWTMRFGDLAVELSKLNLPDCVIDGEAAVQDVSGKTDINLLQKALSRNETHLITLFAFDVRYSNGFDVEGCSLTDRKRLLKSLLRENVTPTSCIQLSELSELKGTDLFAQASQFGLEGIVSKLASSTYRPGRTRNWLKTKSTDISDFVIAGYVEKERRIASLILAREIDGEYEYVGKAGSGLTREMVQQLESHARLDEPCAEFPYIKGATWLEPSLEAQISYRGWTKSHSIRQPSVLKFRQNNAAVVYSPKLVSDRDLATIRITNPDRELFGSNATKLDLAVFYARVGDNMLPHILGRPITLIRSPSGKLEDCFYQRHAFEGLPDGIDKVSVPEKEGELQYLVIEEPVGFLSLAQYGVIEFHPWACRADRLDRPDRLVIDLDPDDDVDWSNVVSAAQLVGERFKDLGLEPFLRSTGGKGLHVVVPIVRRHGWRTFSEFAYAFVQSIAHDLPRQFTTSPAKKDRKGRIYLDHLRNRKGATAVASYSVRAREGLPVAMPLKWSEIRQLEIEAPLTLLDILYAKKPLAKDPWADIELAAGTISKAVQKKIGMREK